MPGPSYRDMSFEKTRSYQPKKNHALVATHSIRPAWEYIKFDQPPQKLTEAVDDDERVLRLISDTWAEINGTYAKFDGDGLFIFNALMHAARVPMFSHDLMLYGSGFKHLGQPNYSTYFMRAVEAIDASGVDASSGKLVERSEHGSGTNRTYRLGNYAVVDCRSRLESLQ